MFVRKIHFITQLIATLNNYASSLPPANVNWSVFKPAGRRLVSYNCFCPRMSACTCVCVCVCVCVYPPPSILINSGVI